MTPVRRVVEHKWPSLRTLPGREDDGSLEGRSVENGQRSAVVDCLTNKGGIQKKREPT